MDPKIAQEILDDLIGSLEALEARSTAVLEFLKHQGIASDEKLAPYLERAASASNVRWLGVRLRVERLLSSAEKDSAEKRTDKAEKKPQTTQTKPAEKSRSDSEAEDNSKSAGPENPKANTHKNKNTKTMSEDAESKSKIADGDSTRNDKNVSHPGANVEKSRSAESGTEQKVA